MQTMIMIDELLAPLFTTIWGRRTGLAVLVIAALLAAITFVQMFFVWHSDIKLTQSTVQQHIDREPAGSVLAKQIAQIPEWHLFGKYGAADSILPVTSLQIHLVGVVKATPEKYSRVIISESSQPGKVYQIGDSLPTTGVRIYAITADGVVLDNSGRLEKLPLQRTPLLFQGKPKSLLGE